MTIKTIDTNEQLINLADNEAFTFEGAGGDLKEWFEGVNDALEDAKIQRVNEMITFKGKLMNDTYGLTGNNKYPDDLTFLCFKLDGLDISKLAIFKMQVGARWLSDIVDNNKAKEISTSIH